jgi:HAE1 family hydrophobic/amphiphilic exporter-1
VVVVGGLLFSQLITLYITPVVYTYLDAWQHRFARHKVKESLEYTEPRAGEARAAEAAG